MFDEVLDTLIDVGWQLYGLWLAKLQERDEQRLRSSSRSVPAQRFSVFTDLSENRPSKGAVRGLHRGRFP